MTRMAATLALALTGLLAGCALAPARPFDAFGIRPGDSLASVLQRAGEPSARLPVAGGTRLQYVSQPYGRYAVMVDVGADGRVLRARQTLGEVDFARVEPGRWTREDILREFGTPMAVERVSSWDGDILAYRWFDPDGLWAFWWVYLDRQGRVQRAHPGMEYVHAPDKE